MNIEQQREKTQFRDLGLDHKPLISRKVIVARERGPMRIVRNIYGARVVDGGNVGTSIDIGNPAVKLRTEYRVASSLPDQAKED